MDKAVVRAFVDRFEGDQAVLLVGDEGRPLLWPARNLPPGAREGVIVRIEVLVDDAATKSAEDVINSLIDRLERGD